MKWLLIAALMSALLTLGAGIAFKTQRRTTDSSSAARLAGDLQYEKHYVTSQQLVASGAMSAHSLGPVTAMAHDGKRRDWAELTATHPVVLVFIKKNCPCNVELEPFFHRLYQVYQGAVQFVGVIDGEKDAARQYVEANHVPYLVLADPDCKLIGRCQAKNGAYVALVSPAGVLHTLWPGCSADMMHDLSRQIASLAGVAEQSVNTSGLPNVLTTGCPFAVDVKP